ncbi:MAG: DUF4290 domain-containing protein [Bacteroidia bacterium]|nr:DUF4290 domain-containing protein [Bacteroidia bacterium]
MLSDKDYNTQRIKLVLPEYGRTVFNMVQFCKSVNDRDLRNKVAREIIIVMGGMFPHLRDVPDFKHKLWDHLFIMADFDLDIDSPYPRPEPDTLYEKPRRIPYPQSDIKFRHYGKIMEIMIKKAITFEDEDKKQLLIEQLANHMKKSYLTWNRESVDDDLILADFRNLSGGKINPSAFKLMDSKDIPKKPKQKEKQKNKKFGRN